jgi:hypothetical protein
MPSVKAARDVSSLINDFEELRSRCERMTDLLAGLTVLFTSVAALVLVVGFRLNAPLFAVSAAFAFAAALGFGVSAWRLGHKGPTVASRPILTTPRVDTFAAPAARVDSFVARLRKAA